MPDVIERPIAVGNRGAAIARYTNFWYCGAMGKNTSIVLSDHFADFTRRKVESGEFSSTSEVVREALREYMAKDAQIEALRAILQKSIDSGPARPFDWDGFMERNFGVEPLAID
jgi:antitoxin ParD1/3/4